MNFEDSKNAKPPIIFSIPNRDSFIGRNTFCSKKTLQKGWIDKLGKQIDYCGKKMFVKRVKITEEEIIVELVKEIIIPEDLYIREFE